MNGERKTHESYGKIKIGHYTSTREEFYGSEVIHHGGVSIEISESVFERDLASNWYHAGDSIVGVKMSANQFAELITMGMNTDGVPCTILHANGKRRARFEMESVEDVFNKDFEARIDKAAETLDLAMKRLTFLMGEKTIKKSDAEGLLKELHNARMQMTQNAPFVKKQFDEYMTNAFTELKTDAEHYIETGLKRLGLDSLKDSIGNEKRIG